MARLRINHRRLVRVSMATIEMLQNWREGVSLANDSGLTIDELASAVAAGRWKLASEHRRNANALLALARPQFRNAVSRYYYSMYHAMRAASYLHHGGDDFESHSTLPQKVPSDFPNAAVVQNTLKNARLARNAADYDPYPSGGKFWESQARIIKSDADALLVDARDYLRGKGCTGI